MKKLRDVLSTLQGKSLNQDSGQKHWEDHDREHTYLADAHPFFYDLYVQAKILSEWKTALAKSSSQPNLAFTSASPTEDVDGQLTTLTTSLLEFEIPSSWEFTQAMKIWEDVLSFTCRDGHHNRYFKLHRAPISALCFAPYANFASDTDRTYRPRNSGQVHNHSTIVVTYPEIAISNDRKWFRLMGYAMSPQGPITLSPEWTNVTTDHGFQAPHLSDLLNQIYLYFDEAGRSDYNKIFVIRHFFPSTIPQDLKMTLEGAALSPENRLIQAFDRYANVTSASTRMSYSVAALTHRSLVIRCVGNLNSGSEGIFTESNTSINLENIAHFQLVYNLYGGHPGLALTFKNYIQQESLQRDFFGSGLSLTQKRRPSKQLHYYIGCDQWTGAQQINLALDEFLLAQKPASLISSTPTPPSRRQEMD